MDSIQVAEIIAALNFQSIVVGIGTIISAVMVVYIYLHGIRMLLEAVAGLCEGKEYFDQDAWEEYKERYKD